MKRLLTNYFAGKSRAFLHNSSIKKCLYQYNFDTDEEIIESYLGNYMLIGINLPDSRNVLTETAIDKLCKSVKNFQSNDEMLTAIIHGCGGNFCTGLAHTENAFKKSRELIDILYKGKKPTMASLNGYTTNFGFHLALMCDLRVMDEHALVSFGSEEERSEILPVVYHKLVLTVGLPKAMEMILTKCTWKAVYAQESGFSNRTVECGTALGQCMTWAQSLGTYHPLDRIIQEKSQIDAVLHKMV